MKSGGLKVAGVKGLGSGYRLFGVSVNTWSREVEVVGKGTLKAWLIFIEEPSVVGGQRTEIRCLSSGVGGQSSEGGVGEGVEAVTGLLAIWWTERVVS